MRGSLRRRISIGVIGITSGVVLVAAVGIWLATRTVLLGGADQELAQRAERLRRFTAMPMPQGWRHRPPPPESREPRGGDRGESQRLSQILATADGRELDRSSALPEGSTLVVEGALAAPVTTRLADGRRVRVLALELPRSPPFVGSYARPEDAPVVAYLGLELEPLDAELRRMGIMLAALWTAATVLAAVSVAGVAGAILRPVRQLSDAIDRLGPDDLSARIGPAAGPSEVRCMVRRLNGLLDRLEQAFRREQATIGSIAHELRTPVAALRSDIEFRLLAGPGPEEAAVLHANLATVERMQAMVANLLMLARLEAGKEVLQRGTVDVAGQLAAAVESWEAKAAARGAAISLAAPETAAASTSDVHLRLIIDNLLGNAVAHGAAGTIEVSLSAGDGWLTLQVANPCTAAIDADQLGQAFYRADAARSSGDHCGLGLALCRRLSRLIGARLALEAGEGRFRAICEIPVNGG